MSSAALSQSTEIPPKLHFKVEGRLAQLLGRQAILNEVMAIFELCKNGYDADAPKIEVFFEDIEKANGKIRIVDTGHGMNLEDITNKFMMVATSSKIVKKTSPGGRIIVGEKGIGRFAMERLSHKTIVYSYPENESNAYKLTIDWDRYEVEGITFTEVSNEFEEIVKTDPKKQGVEIIAENLRDKWSKGSIEKLERQLGKLVAPKETTQISPFEILLHAKEFDFSERKVKSKYFTKAPYRLVGTLLPEGEVTIQVWYKNKKIIGKGIDHRYSEDGKAGDNIARCGPVTYEMWGFPFDKFPETKWENVYGKRFLPNIREWVKDNQGIRIYRDGFRVMPYGEPANDWTDRGIHSRMLSGALPKANIVGWIKITEKDNPLIPSATRFHLIEDDDGPFSDLKNFVILCDKVLDRVLHWERVQERKKIQKNIPEQLDKFAKKITGMKDLPLEIRSSLSRESREYATYLRDEIQEKKRFEDRLMSKLEAYRDLASLGITTSLISHEISHDLSNLIGISEEFEEGIKRNNLTKKDLTELQTNLSASVRFIRDYMSLVRNFTVTLKGDQDEFRKKTILDVKKEIEFYGDRMSTLLERHNIKFHIVIPDDLQIYMYRADFQSIIFNLISNSIKSILRRRNTLTEIDKAKTENIIKINLDSNPGTTYFGIVFSDDGTGVRPSIRDRIFDMFFSDYKKENEIMRGSGLGLSLVQEIAESYGGSIELTESEFRPGASFLIRLKRESILMK